jgi:hypothetical protein
VPGVLMGQLTEEINPKQIYSVLMELGFTHVCEAETGAEILRKAMSDFVNEQKETNPGFLHFVLPSCG